MEILIVVPIALIAFVVVGGIAFNAALVIFDVIVRVGLALTFFGLLTYAIYQTIVAIGFLIVAIIEWAFAIIAKPFRKKKPVYSKWGVLIGYQ